MGDSPEPSWEVAEDGKRQEEKGQLKSILYVRAEDLAEKYIVKRAQKKKVC